MRLAPWYRKAYEARMRPSDKWPITQKSILNLMPAEINLELKCPLT